MSNSAYFPVFLKIRDRSVLVVGGGEVAARKIRLLRRAGARVRVIAQSLNAELQALADAGDLSWDDKAFSASQLDECMLVVAATDDGDLNRA
ncbi:MAG: precorrin-2 dehydrogenase/sirohydrochlorin ferrochelatase family protein, partial [Panacagrimonas sp.]